MQAPKFALGFLICLLAIGCSDRTSAPTIEESTGGPQGPLHGSDGPLFAPPGAGEKRPVSSPDGGEAGGGPGGGENQTGGGGGPSGSPGGPGGSGGGPGGGPGSAVPEPGTMLLVGSGLAGLAWSRRRRRRDDDAEAEVA